MNQNEPLVSVIIPTYKRDKKVLLRAIDSIIKQTYSNIEIVVINDNPKGANLENYLDCPNLKYIHNSVNLGGALTRNVGIKEARGEYITFLDDDDIYLPEKVKNQLQFMISNSLEVSITNLIIHNENGITVDYRNHEKAIFNDDLDILRWHFLHHLTGTNAIMFKSEALRSIGGFDDSKVSQEFYLMYKAIKNGLRFGYLNANDVINYIHSGNRISTGYKKLEGERQLYEFKKQHFAMFSRKEKRYIRFRYHLVLGIAGLRSKMISVFLKHTFVAFVCSPIFFISEYLGHRNRKRKLEKK